MQTFPTSTRASANIGNGTKLGEIYWRDASTGQIGEIEVTSPKCTIGSHPSSTIVLPETIAAATHLTLIFGKRFTLLKAPFPTRIHGRLVREWLIDEPTEFSIGTCLFQIVPFGAGFKSTSVVRAHQLIETANRLSEPLAPNQFANAPDDSQSMASPMASQASVSSITDIEKTLSRFDSIETSLDQLRTSLGQIQEAVAKVPTDSLSVSKSLAEEFSQLGQNLSIQISAELRSQFEQRLDERDGLWNDALRDGVNVLDSQIQSLALKVESLGEMQGNLEETATIADRHRSNAMEERFQGFESRLSEFANRIEQVAQDSLQPTNPQPENETADLGWRNDLENRIQSLQSQRDDIFRALDSVRSEVHQFGSIAQSNFEYLLQQWQTVPSEQTSLDHSPIDQDGNSFQDEHLPSDALVNDADNEPDQQPSLGQLSEFGGTLPDYEESVVAQPADFYEPTSQSDETVDDWQVPSRHDYPGQEQEYAGEDYAREDYAREDYAREDYAREDYAREEDSSQVEVPTIDSLVESAPLGDSVANESEIVESAGDSFLRPNLEEYNGGYDYSDRLAQVDQPGEPDSAKTTDPIDEQMQVESEVDIDALSARLRRLLAQQSSRSDTEDPNGSITGSSKLDFKERLSETFPGFGTSLSANLWTDSDTSGFNSDEHSSSQSQESTTPSSPTESSLLDQFLHADSKDELEIAGSSYSDDSREEFLETTIQSTSDRVPNASEEISSDLSAFEDESIGQSEIEDHSPAESNIIQPVAQASNQPNSRGNDNEEDSIEAYMQKLLQRVKSGPDTVGDVSSAPITEVKTAPRSRSEFLNRGSRETNTSPITEANAGAKASLLTEGEFVPRQQAPERKNDLDLLRELANKNARRAITKSDSKKMSSAILLKIAITSFALAAALTLLAINGLQLNPPFAGMVAAMIVAVLWGYDCLKHFRLLGTVKANQVIENDRVAAVDKKNELEQLHPTID